MAKQKTEKSTKIKKKTWFPIVAPKYFKNASLGDILVVEPGVLIGRPVKHNLANLINDIKKQSINIKFKIDRIEGNKAYTVITGYHMIPASIKRFTRRRKSKVEMSFVCRTSDNKRVRIKPILFTRNLTRGSVTKALHNEAKETMTRLISKTSFENLITDLISLKFQHGMKKRFSKIYPLKEVVVKALFIEESKKAVKEEKVKPEEIDEKDEDSEGEEEKSDEKAPEEAEEVEKKEGSEDKEAEKTEEEAEEKPSEAESQEEEKKEETEEKKVIEEKQEEPEPEKKLE